MTLATINRKIQETDPNVTLVRGTGYHYYVFDTPSVWESEMVMVPYTNRMTGEWWIDNALSFGKRIREDKGLSPVRVS